MSLNDKSDNNGHGSTGRGVPGFYFSAQEDPLREETKHGDEQTKNGENDDTRSLSSASSFSFTNSNGTKIEVQTLGDVLGAVPEERRWTVEGLLPDCGLAVLGGHAKAGKSTLAMHLGRSVEAGDTFLDRDTEKKAVVYINYEMPDDYFASLSRTEPMPENFYVITRPEPKLATATIKAVIGEFKKRAVERGIMVIDSFRGAFKLTGEQENHAGEAGRILRQLQEIGVQSGWLIVLIHHHKKGGEGRGADKLSGTGDFAAAADVIWTWARTDPLKPGVLEIEGRMPPVDPLQVVLSPDECVFLGTKQEGNEEDEKKRILQVLDDADEGLTGQKIASKAGIPYSTVMKRLKSLKDERSVTFETGDGKGSPKLWYARFIV